VKERPSGTLASVIALTRSDESVVQFAVKRRFRMEKAEEARKTLMVDLIRRGIKAQWLRMSSRVVQGGEVKLRGLVE
jgi:hypothetical protein